MKELEQKAFDLWCTDAPEAFKRIVVTQLYEAIEARPNSTNKTLLARMRSVNANINDITINDAVASLRTFGVVATVPSKQGADVYHVNIIKKKTGFWQAYKNTH